MSPNPKDPLDELLDRGSAIPSCNDITNEVWRRISHTEIAEDETGLIPIIHGWFGRWPFAALFVASCILTGLLLAELRVNQLERERSTQLARSYLVLIDPLMQEISTENAS